MAIVESATEFLSLKPTATLQEIADYSKIGIATLHRHFSCRDELLHELALNAIRIVEEAIASIKIDVNDARSSLVNLIKVLIPLGNKISFLGADGCGYCNPNIDKEEVRVLEPIQKAIKEWQNNGQLRNDMPAKWIMSVLYYLLFVSWSEIQAGNIARNDAAEYLLNTILSGFEKK